MKHFLTITFIILTTTAFGQAMNSGEWNRLAETNIRLLPKYGHRPKTAEQIAADSAFIATTMKDPKWNGDQAEASAHMIELGFNYLNRSDLKTAMYRFNQAYLLDSSNSDIYWGYGAVYMSLGSLGRAEEQYVQGLKAKPTNTHLLTDYAAYYMTQYYALQPMDERQAVVHLDSALSLLTRSYQLDKTDANTVLKLSVCYWCKNDCKNAWRYYDECVALGGQPIGEDYTAGLKEKCPRGK